MRSILAAISFLGLASPGLAQEAADSASGSRRPAISGFAEVSYAYTSRGDADAIVGRLYDRFHDEFVLNALTVILDAPFNPATLSAGAHAEVVYGQNASVIKSAGFDLGEQGDAPHLFVTLNVPTADGHGVQFKLGRVPTLMGLEVIETPSNPNWSEGSQFIYLENFTNTGVSVEHKFSDRVDAQLRMFNGWDLVKDNNTRRSFMGRVGWYQREGTTVAVVGFVGPEEADDPSADRYGGELLLGSRLGAKTVVWLQGDVGGEEANPALPDPSRDAAWYAVGAWLVRDFSPTVGLALRGDYVDDRDGARTSGVLGFPANTGHRFGSATATLNLRSWAGLLLRPEVRYDRSNLAAYDGEQDQLSLALSAAYAF